MQPHVTLGGAAPLRHLNNQLSINLQDQDGLGQRTRSVFKQTMLTLEKHSIEGEAIFILQSWSCPAFQSPPGWCLTHTVNKELLQTKMHSQNMLVVEGLG